MHTMLFAADLPLLLHRAMNVLIDLTAGLIIRRHNQRPLRRAHVLSGYLTDTLFAVFDLQHATLLVEVANRCAHLASCKLFDGFFERRVFLPDDLVEPGRAHSRLL